MMTTRPNVQTCITPYEVLFARKPRTLWNVSPYLEYDHDQMLKLRAAVDDAVKHQQWTKVQSTGQRTIPPLEVGQLVKLVKPFPRRPKYQSPALGPKYRSPALGPYRITKQLSTTGYEVQHVVTNKKVEAPIYWLQPLQTRDKDGEPGPAEATEPTNLQRETMRRRYQARESPKQETPRRNRPGSRRSRRITECQSVQPSKQNGR